MILKQIWVSMIFQELWELWVPSDPKAALFQVMAWIPMSDRPLH